MSENFLLWPLLAFWMGLAFVVLFTIVGVIAWSSVHLVRDAFGQKDTVWCPGLRRDLRVQAVPRHFFTGGLRFARLHKCERWGSGPIECGQPCLCHEQAGQFAI